MNPTALVCVGCVACITGCSGGAEEPRGCWATGCPEPAMLRIALPEGALGFGLIALGSDVDGDGLGDVLATVPERLAASPPASGRVFVFSGLDGSVVLELSAEPGDEFGADAAIGPDADGDGVADLIVGAPAAEGRGVAATFSGASGLLMRSIRTGNRNPDASCQRFGESVSLGPDIDGDGRGDVGATDVPPVGCMGSSYYLRSGADGADIRGRERFYVAEGLGYRAIQVVTDADGDGRADLLLHYRGADGLTGPMVDELELRVKIQGDLDVIQRWHSEPLGCEWSRPDGRGEVDGSGAVDIVAPCASASGNRVLALTTTRGAPLWEALDSAVGSLGPDADGDARSDVATGSGAEGRPGTVRIHRGVSGEELWSRTAGSIDAFGTQVSLGPDADGDGLADLAVAAEGSPDAPSAIYVFYSGQRE